MKTLCLVSCVSKKNNGILPAKDLYCSTWFNKAKKRAEQYDNWLILSAKYGLIIPNQRISKYNLTLNQMTEKQRQIWSIKIYHQLKNHLKNIDNIIFFAGVNYRKYLAPQLIKDGYKVDIPMKGLGIGKQMQWLGK